MQSIQPSDEMCGRVPMHQCVPNVLQRDSRSIRDASPAAGAVKNEELKGLPDAYSPESFCFPAITGDHRHARRNSRPCRPQSRRLSELSVFRKWGRVVPFTAWAFRISVVVVVSSSSTSLLFCSLFFSRAAVSSTSFHDLQFYRTILYRMA